MQRLRFLSAFVITLTTCFVSPVCAVSLLSARDSIDRLVGDEVLLECRFSDLGGSAIKWYNTSMEGMNHRDLAMFLPKFNGQMNPQDPRMQVLLDRRRSFDLRIVDLRLSDEGIYVCSVYGGRKRVEYRLHINVPPTVTMRPSVASMGVGEGSPLSLICLGEGKPKPIVSWTREDADLPSGRASFEGTHYAVDALGKHDGGVYVCTASNSYGRPARQTVHVNVEYKPTVRIKRPFRLSYIGARVGLDCVFDSNPKVKVSWSFAAKHGGRFEPVEHVAEGGTTGIRKSVSHRDHVTHAKLLFSSLQPAQQGLYRCSGHNVRGEASALTELSARPSQLKIRSARLSKYSDAYLLDWHVHSLDVPLHFQLLLIQNSPNGSVEVASFTVTNRGDRKDGPNHRDSHVFSNLETDTNYTVKIRARNVAGDSDWTYFTFATAAEEKPHVSVASVYEDLRETNGAYTSEGKLRRGGRNGTNGLTANGTPNGNFQLLFFLVFLLS